MTDAWSFAAPFTQPIVTTDYRHHIPPFKTPIPNLWDGYSIALAEKLVKRILDA